MAQRAAVEEKWVEIKCAFCGGTGVYDRSRLSCGTCGGKGVVPPPRWRLAARRS